MKVWTLGIIASALAAWSFSCAKEAGQPVQTADAKTPILVYYTIPG